MKNLMYTVITIAGLVLLTSCKGKKFEATVQERNDYNEVYNYLKNIRENLAKKELEPNLMAGFIETADKIVDAGDATVLEKSITHNEFLKGLEKARFFKKTLMNKEPLDNKMFKMYEKSYLDIKQKIIKLKPDYLELTLNKMETDESTKSATVFIGNQIKKYNFQTFLDKTIIAPSQLETTFSNIKEIIDFGEMDEALNELKTFTDSVNGSH